MSKSWVGLLNILFNFVLWREQILDTTNRHGVWNRKGGALCRNLSISVAPREMYKLCIKMRVGHILLTAISQWYCLHTKYGRNMNTCNDTMNYQGGYVLVTINIWDTTLQMCWPSSYPPPPPCCICCCCCDWDYNLQVSMWTLGCGKSILGGSNMSWEGGRGLDWYCDTIVRYMLADTGGLCWLICTLHCYCCHYWNSIYYTGYFYPAVAQIVM